MATELPKYSVPPPLPPIAALVMIVLVAVVAPISFLPQAVSLALGIPLALLSIGLWGWGMSSFVRRKENPLPNKPTERLLTGGAFGVSRHPLYAGETGGLVALAVLLDTMIGLAVALIAALFARSVAIAEERYLEARFGEEYRAYRERVRRWI
jgi:protein-S-isoprenylcysteine O-methyltransferase Ste14